MSDRDAPYVTTDEDMEVGYVAVDEFAATARLAHAALLAACRSEWAIVWTDGPPRVGDMARVWFKPDPEDEHHETLIACSPDDPDREGEWWQVELPDHEYDWSPHA